MIAVHRIRAASIIGEWELTEQCHSLLDGRPFGGPRNP
jgi:hypothetical protein